MEEQIISQDQYKQAIIISDDKIKKWIESEILNLSSKNRNYLIPVMFKKNNFSHTCYLPHGDNLTIIVEDYAMGSPLSFQLFQYTANESILWLEGYWGTVLEMEEQEEGLYFSVLSLHDDLEKLDNRYIYMKE